MSIENPFNNIPEPASENSQEDFEVRARRKPGELTPDEATELRDLLGRINKKD